jgi:hypothetical protein
MQGIEFALDQHSSAYNYVFAPGPILEFWHL